MFLMLGFGPRQKTFEYNKVFICDRCGQYGRYEVIMQYTALEVFFIPLLKGDQKYFVKSTCCGTLYQLDPSIGKAISKGHDVEIRPEHLRQVQEQSYSSQRRCSQCGFVTENDFQYCPNCGKKFTERV